MAKFKSYWSAIKPYSAIVGLYAMLLTAAVLKLLICNSVKLAHPLNIYAMFDTFSVLKPDTLSEDSDEQFWNI